LRTIPKEYKDPADKPRIFQNAYNDTALISKQMTKRTSALHSQQPSSQFVSLNTTSQVKVPTNHTPTTKKILLDPLLGSDRVNKEAIMHAKGGLGVWDILVKADVEQYQKEETKKLIIKKRKQEELRKFYDGQHHEKRVREMSERQREAKRHNDMTALLLAEDRKDKGNHYSL